MVKTGDSMPAVPTRPTVTLPPRPSMEALFSGGFGVSPGPMTLLSNFLSPDSNCSFSQLLAGAMASPIAHAGRPNSFFPDNYMDNSGKEKGYGEAADKDFGFRQSRPTTLAVARSPMFTIPPGLSPSGLLNSPGFFSPHSPFGMSHQQALAQVTAQAVLAQQSQMHLQADYQPLSVRPASDTLARQPSLNPNEGSYLQVAPATSTLTMAGIESTEASQSNKKYQSPPLVVDKPAGDGYNWRKYGQKQVKGSEYPRSYYKCTHLNCPVKKKVERSPDGQITEIIYKGQHTHEVPQQNKRAKDGSNSIGNLDIQAKSELHPQNSGGNSNMSGKIVHEQSVPAGLGCNQELSMKLSGSSDNEEACGADRKENEDNHDEPPAKRRNTESLVSELPMSQNAITEPKIIVQTRSEVDLLDDGYRWRKYGQKVVKGNPHPRSYYKCTSSGCNVRKHVERASTDPKAVVTTYEGKHNHDVPVGRNSSHTSVRGNVVPLKAHMEVPEKHHLLKEMNIGKDDQRPVSLRLKEEQIAL